MKKQLTDADADTLITDDYSADALWNQKLDVAGIFRMRKELERKREQSKRQRELAGAEHDSDDLKEETEDVFLIAGIIPSSDLLIFKLNAGDVAAKTEWQLLPARIREVLEEIIYSLPISSNDRYSDDGCYTFSYTDDEFDLSIISIVVDGKAVLFYKDARGTAFVSQ